MSLVPRFTFGDLDLTDHPYMLEWGSDLGNPENMSEVLGSLLADGEIESLSRRSNRTLTIPVTIEGADLLAIADAEQALIAECDKQRNTLTVDPGDGIAPATVFETFAAQATRTYGDDEEIANLRRWTLTIRALPYGRSVDLIVDNAGTPPSTGGTLLYSADTTTGWSKWFGSGTFTADTSIKTEGTASVRSPYNSPHEVLDPKYRLYSNSDQVAGLSMSTGTGGYMSMSIRWDLDSPSVGTSGLKQLWMTTAAGEVQITDFMSISTDANGFVQYVWPVDASLTVTALRFTVHQYGTPGQSASALVWYDNFQLLPSATTDHQIVKQLAVQGSARTTGSLHIAAATDVVALGKVLAITVPTDEVPAGFTPDGRRWVTQGTTTADATTPDGSYYTPTTTYSSAATYPIFDVPVSLTAPGPYTIVALVKAESSTLTAGVQAQLRVNGTNVGPTSAAEVSPTGLATGWQFITVGTVYLPPLPVQNAASTTKVRLLFKGAKMSNVYMIPAWQVGGRPVADFSIVDCGTGTPAAGGSSSNLWIDSPSVAQPQGGWWRGPTSDRLNTQSAWPDAKKPGLHTFSPGSLTAFLVSTNAQGPTMTLEYYPGWVGSAAS